MSARLHFPIPQVRDPYAEESGGSVRLVLDGEEGKTYLVLDDHDIVAQLHRALDDADVLLARSPDGSRRNRPGPMAGHAVEGLDENPAPMRSRPYPAPGEDVPRPDTGSVATGEAAGPHAPGYLAQVGPGHLEPVRAQAAGQSGSNTTATAHGPALSEPLEPLPARDEAADDKAQADSVSLLARWGADPSEVTAAGDDDGATKSIAAINAAHDELDAEERQRTEALPAVADEGEQR